MTTPATGAPGASAQHQSTQHPSNQHPPGQSRLDAAREALAAAERSAAASGPRESDVPAALQGEVDSDAYATARQIVLRQLTVGPRTRKQLGDKLRQRAVADDVAAQVLDRMADVGLVDDAAFARMFTQSRREQKGLAAPMIRQELREKGVSDELIDEALADVAPEVERDQARALVSKRVRALHGLDREVQTRRLAGFLARKGYGPGVSYQVIQEALDQAVEHQRD